MPILALTPSLRVARDLAGVWGIHAVEVAILDDHMDMEALAVRVATEENFAARGDHLVITAGLPLRTMGPTNVMRLVQVEPGLAAGV